MRILYVSQYFPPEPGAPAARVSELARAWVAAGHQVTVLTGMPNHPAGVVPPEYQGRALVREDYFGVDVVRTWIYAAANKGRARRSLAYASFAASALVWGQLHVGDFDVLVATSPQLLCGLAGGVISELRRTPFVFEVRDLWPESIVAVGALPEGHPIVRALTLVELALYDAADRIVVVTDSFRTRLIERGIPEGRLAVVKNGVDLTRFQAGSRETALRERLGWQGKVVVSYVGTHGMAHGLDAVLDVARDLKPRDEVRFVFAGDGAERVALEARVANEGLTNVTFLGLLPREAMSEVYATSDICLVPLRNAELFRSVIPSKIFEIMASERPIILSVDGESRAMVEASGGGVFAAPEDVPAIAAAIHELADDPARRAAMGTAGRAFVIDQYDRTALSARYLDILEDVRAAASERFSPGRLARTVARLHPLQIFARPGREVVSRLLRDVPVIGAPKLRGPSGAVEPLRALARAERERGARRLARLAPGSLLRAYEERYGLEVGDEGAIDAGRWQGPVAVAPYVASVRARRLAVASRLGATIPRGELARAARAVLLQPELHLLANHLLENGFGLCTAGCACEGREADLWWRAGSAILEWQLGAQFFDDGGHFEGSATYHLALTHGLLEVLCLARAAGRPTPRAWSDVALRACEWAVAVRAPDGGYPLFNDASFDAAPTLDAVVALGETVLAREMPARTDPITTLPDTGWVILRGYDGAWCAMDAGPDGADVQPGHVHADALSFVLYVEGEPAVVDYGVASYANDRARADSRATCSHNTLELLGRDSSEVWSAFRVGRRCRARVESTRVTNDALVVTAAHDGYRSLPGSPAHRRTLTLRAGSLAIDDAVSPFTRGVSRVRVDAASRVAVTGAGLSTRAGVWFPELGAPRAATVYEAAVDPSTNRINLAW